jgi:hypothetical protein
LDTAEKQLKCKLPGCRTNREGVKTYSNTEGTLRFNLCVNCRKLPFGMALVPYEESDKSIKKSSDDKNATAKKRADDAAGTKAEALGMCQYPSCTKEGCKLWITKAPHPITKLHKGRYCEFHRDVLNADNRVLPYRYGRVAEIVTDHALTLRPINFEDLARKEGVTPRAVRLLFRAAVIATDNDPNNIETTDKTIRLKATVTSGVNDTTPEAVVVAVPDVPDDIRKQAIVEELRSQLRAGTISQTEFETRTAALETGGGR